MNNLTTKEEIKRQMLEDYAPERLTEDTLNEITDNNLPIYYSDIIKEWTALEGEYCDTWQDYPITAMSSITGLMTIDLYNYYYSLAWEAYEEIQAEKATLELEEAN
jgi:hypothetical protein